LVFADPVRIEQMLLNLVDNAVKFNRNGGSVTVSISGANGRDIIEVADTGEGISAEHIGRIFERFYRGDRSRARLIGGTGLGLSIVKHLARLHGGEVYVSSKLGIGTSFYIELPSAPGRERPGNFLPRRVFLVLYWLYSRRNSAGVHLNDAASFFRLSCTPGR